MVSILPWWESLYLLEEDILEMKSTVFVFFFLLFERLYLGEQAEESHLLNLNPGSASY